jgi:hypothetical protein
MSLKVNTVERANRSVAKRAIASWNGSIARIEIGLAEQKERVNR